MQITEQELQQIIDQSTKQAIEKYKQEVESSRGTFVRRDPVRREMGLVQDEYAKEIQSLANGYVWGYIQRIACLLNGYSQQRWVLNNDAEKVATTAKELCERIVKAFEEKKK